MTEIKMENGKSNVCRDDNNPSFLGVSSNTSFLGLTRESSNAHNERGRSMVEMLGVLAVAGVLSIGGGVAGYRYAIDKMNANDIINEVKKRAVTASQQRILGQNINLSEYGDNGRIKGIHAVTATNDYAGDKGFFALTVSNVPQRVCDEILKQDWAMPVEMAVGEFIVEDDTVCAEGDNEMLFAFHNTLDNSLVPGEGGEEEETPSPDEANCSGHGTACGCGCSCDAGWSGDDCSIETGDCINGTEVYCGIHCDCSTGWYGERCASTDPCADHGTLNEDATCSCEEGYFANTGRDGSCFSCSTAYVGVTSADECAKCDTTSTPRVLTPWGYCALPCSDGEFMSAYGSCYSCSSTSNYITATADECAKCDDTETPRYMNGNYCQLSS